ncbi:MAG: hypothetical protein MK171_10140 [Pirellulales bacterium]|nr:hypothetical protein [Pirellulales bacterium]
MFPRILAFAVGVMALVVPNNGAAWGQDLAAIFDNAVERFSPPPETWFTQTQQALAEEVERISLVFDRQGGEDARYWKNHLRWELLKKNLGPQETVDVEALAVVRRWSYSNRPGLEGPFFAELRLRIDAYLDAAFTLAQEDLYEQFKQQIVIAQEQCDRLEERPTDAHAAALARTLGWLERTGQLSDEIAAVRAHALFPNAQVLVTYPLIGRVLSRLAGDVQQTIGVTDQVQTPTRGVLRSPRTLNVRGTARTWGAVGLEMVPNSDLAELSLVYRGHVESQCRADAGPVRINVETKGPVVADTPVYLDLDRLRSGATSVTSQVHTRMTRVSASSEVLRRIAERRATQPEAQSVMRSRSRAKTASMLQKEVQNRIDEALGEIRAEVSSTRAALAGFSDVLASVVREGAAPQLLGTRSTVTGIEVNGLSGRRGQWGAPTPCPFLATGEDVAARVHVSFFNNLAETIMAGKRFTDKYFMNYANILQAELPLPLMVHSRSQRWAMIAAPQRPLVLQIPAPNRFDFTLRMQGIELDGEEILVPAIAKVSYQITHNDLDEFRLERVGSLQLHSDLDSEMQSFLHGKLSAFFAPVLDGGGVVIPDGGALGRVAALEVLAITVDRDWIVVQISGVEQLFLPR